VTQEWYYSVDGSQQGPVTAAELKKLATDGKIKAEDLVWKDGMAEWKAANTIKGLFGAGTASGGTVVPKADSKAVAKPEADDRPSKRGRDEDEEEDRPRKRRDEDEEEDRPRNRRREEEDDEDRPRKRRDEDDDEYDRPRKKKKRGGRIPDDVGSKKMTAGLLGILLGAYGVHKFYLGMSSAGVIQLIVTIVTCGLAGIIGLIEGIIYLTKSDEDFYREYIVGQKQWF
jgi:TM2 domain-containing membrane protein YozV